MEIHNRWRFADVVLELNEVVALVKDTVYLRDGREIDVGVAAADALREATPPVPERAAKWLEAESIGKEPQK